MKTLPARVLLLCAVALLPAAFARGAAQERAVATAPPGSSAKADANANAPAVTRHVISVQGQRLAYTATAGTMPLADEAGKLQASIFYVAYAKQRSGSEAPRPITFAFNGGPGASSMWLHLGVGPKRVDLPNDGTQLPASTVLSDNEATWLTFTDLVFVDPVGAGYSRAAEGVDAEQFYEVVRDIQVAAGFIRRYLTQNQRWLSPKFIAGESYGTTRAAALANWLQENAGIDVNGVMLISSVLDFHTIAFEPPYDLPYVLALPSYAATAAYHGKLEGSATDLVREAHRWAVTEYLPALAQGATLPQAERARIAQRLAYYTGIDQDELLRRGLRIGPLGFGRQLLESSQRIVGRFDSRVSAAVSSAGGQNAGWDPSFFLVTGPLLEALNHYLREALQYRTDLRYEPLSREANRSWKWRPAGAQGFLYVSDELAQAMVRDPRLRVFAAAGYYDLATPYAAQKYTFDHMELPRALRRNLTFAAYPSGHQIYTHPGAAAQLRADVEQFVGCALDAACSEATSADAGSPAADHVERFDLESVGVQPRNANSRAIQSSRGHGTGSGDRDAR
jgi:carboxypeptidase C (cathepsin A)